MASNTEKQWEAKVSTTLTKASAEQIWPFFTDFFGLCKWFPGLSTCYGIHGQNGELGCIRYCAGFSIPSSEGNSKKDGDDDDDDEKRLIISWSKERLIAIDDVERSLSYEIVDCNIGFKSYVSTIKIVQGGESGGCVIEWCFVVDPVEGWSLDELVKRYETKLQSMANKMENAL